LERLRSYCDENPGIKAVVHFAAFKAVGESVAKPLEYYHNNLVSLINLLQVMREFSIPNIVFSSSCTVYGQPGTLPVTEDSPVKPAASPYGNTKQISEEIIRDTVGGTPLRADRRVSLRNTFEPGPLSHPDSHRYSGPFTGMG
jgi:UDP-glucose 4-epimerase